MKKKNITKTMAISLASIMTVTAPIAAVVSCGAKESNDTVNQSSKSKQIEKVKKSKENKIQALKNELNNLKGIKVASDQKTSIQKEINSKEKYGSSVTKQIKKLEDNIRVISGELSYIKGEKSIKQSKLNDLINELSKANTILSTLKDEKIKLEQTLNKLDDEITQIQRLRKANQLNINLSEGEFKNATIQLKTFTKKHESIVQKINEVNKNKRQLEKNMDAKNIEKGKMDTQIDVLQKLNNKLKNDKVKLNQEEEKLRKSTTPQKEIQRLIDLETTLNDEKAKQEKLLIKVNESLVNKTKSNDINIKIQKITKELEDNTNKKKDLESENKKLEQVNKPLLDELVQEKNTYEPMVKMIKNQEIMIKKHEEKLKDIQLKLPEIAWLKLKRVLDSNSATLSMTEAQKIEKESAGIINAKEIMELNTINYRVNGDKNALKSTKVTIKDLKRKFDEAKAKFDKANKRVEDNKKQVSLIELKIKDSNDQLVKLKNDKSTVDAKISNTQLIDIKLIKAEISRINNEILKNSKQLQDKKSVNILYLNRKQAIIQEQKIIDKEIINNNDKISKTVTTKDLITNEVKIIKEKIKKLITTVLINEEKNAKKEMEGASKDVGDKNTKVISFKNKQTTWNDRIVELGKQRSNKNTEISNKNSLIKTKEYKISDIKSKINELKNKMLDLTAKSKSKDSELQDQKLKLQNEQEKLKHIKDEIDSLLNNDFTIAFNNLKNRKDKDDEIKTQIAKLEKQINLLNGNVITYSAVDIYK